MHSRQRKQNRDPGETSWTREMKASLSETLAHGRQTQIMKDLKSWGLGCVMGEF